MQMSMFSAEEHPASPSATPETAQAWMTRVVNSCSPMVPFLHDTGPAGWFGRTSPASCQATKDETLQAFWDSSAASALSRQKVDGSRPASSPATPTPTAWRGECLTLSLSEWNHTLVPSHSDGTVCSLSDILETGAVPQRYFLSAKACAGILRRAEKRGRALPAQLAAALRQVAGELDPTKRQRINSLPEQPTASVPTASTATAKVQTELLGSTVGSE